MKLTWLELSIAVQRSALPLFYYFQVTLVLLRFSEFSQETELSIKVSSLHAFLKLVQGNSLLNFCHIFILGNPFVG